MPEPRAGQRRVGRTPWALLAAGCALLGASTARAEPVSEPVAEPMAEPIAGRFGGPFGEVSVGYVQPLADDLDDPDDRTYDQIVAGGRHMAVRLGWLVPVLTLPDRRLSIGPVLEAAYTQYGDVAPNDGLAEVTRWRWTGGARIALATPDATVAIEGQVGVDRPSYDFRVDTRCGDPTTSGAAWELTGLGHLTFGRFVVGAAAGVLHGDHADDQPPCTGGVVIDTVDYTSVDLTIQLSLGARL